MNFDEMMQKGADVKCQEFISRLNVSIDGYRLQLIKDRKPNEQFLNLEDVRTITTHVKNYFGNKLNFIPKEIEIACDAALIPLAPDVTTRMKMIHDLKSLGAGVSGMAAILYGFAIACGWGAGVAETVIAFFCGTSILGPLAWIVAGVSLSVVAGKMYFDLSDKIKASERAINGLKEGLKSAIVVIWPQGDNAEKLS